VRILVIDNGLSVEMSGGDFHIIKVAQYWAKTNMIFFLLSKQAYYLASKLLVGKSLVYNTPFKWEYYTKAHGTLGNIILLTLRILKTVLFDPKERFDVIVASSHYPHDVIPAISLKLRYPCSKFVVYFHSLDIPHRAVSLLRIISIMGNYLGALLVKMSADLVFTSNSYTQNFLLFLGIEKRRVFLTNQGVDTRHFALQPKKIFDGCFIGRCVKHKGIYDLLRICDIVRKSKSDFKLAICGYGKESPRISELVRKKKLESNVILLGLVQEDKKYNVLHCSRVFIFPSYLEGWGIAVAEAMACGLPVVTYHLPVYREVFDDKLITVPVGDIDAMAKEVIYLLENPEVAKKIGEANREFVKRYDWKTVAEKELSAIINLINKR